VIYDFGPYFLVIQENDVDYEQEPFASVQEARAKIDRHLDQGEEFRKGC
jgi:hypothetical protein